MSLPRLLTRTLLTAGASVALVGSFAAGSALTGASPQSLPWRDHADGPPVDGSDATPAAYTGSGLSLAGSCEDLLDWYVARGVDRVGPWGWDAYGHPGWLEDGGPFPTFGGDSSEAGGDGAADVEARSSGSGSAASAPTTVRATNGDTGTNVQEVGVDEPDTVKTDGRTLYRVEGNNLVTYDVTGTEVVRLASVDLPGLADAELLLAGEVIVAIAHSGDDHGTTGAETEVVTLDVSDPAAPRTTHTATYDTELVAARLHDGVVRLVLQAGLPDLQFVEPDRRLTEWEATRENQELVRASTIEDWLPTVSTDDGEPEQLLDCEAVAMPADSTSLGTIAVVGFDATAPEAPSTSGLAVDTDLAYASASQLYLATSAMSASGCFDCWLPEEMGSPTMPRWLPGGSDDDGTSQVYAFDLDGLDTTFAASGVVDGAIRDRWAMDEYDGVLRLAVGPTARTGDFNSVLTLRQEGNDLVEVGRVDRLGVGEEIQSVRWFDGLAIVVTFRQIDPLYAIDLTDPDQPQLMGELKVPGFSAYLHPLGQHRLLGLGEGPAPGGEWGAQAGLFNVSDLTQPRRLDVVSYGYGTQALATQDPRQFTWLPDGRTALSVVSRYGRSGEAGYVSVLTVGDGTLTDRMVKVEYGSEVTDVRLVPLPDGRVVLVTGDAASFFDV